MEIFLKELKRFVLIAMFPFILLLIGYLYFDPFKVLYSYDDYSNPYVIPSRDYVSTEMFIKNKDRYHYNSFFFGSSRTVAYSPVLWKKYLDKNDNPFMFDAVGESVLGIYCKIKYLDSIKVPMKNVIILIDRDVSFSYSDNRKSHLFIQHPATSGKSILGIQKSFFEAYLDPKFYFSFYAYTFTKKFKPFMTGYIENRKMTYDKINNQTCIIDQENEIARNPEQYYLKHKDWFYERTEEQIDSDTKIKGKHLKLLKEIKWILEKNHSNYKIIISPAYDQVKFSKPDINLLNFLFRNHLYDFSGKNKFTEDKKNYYEAMHYRPVVGDSILNYIYN